MKVTQYLLCILTLLLLEGCAVEYSTTRKDSSTLSKKPSHQVEKDNRTKRTPDTH